MSLRTFLFSFVVFMQMGFSFVFAQSSEEAPPELLLWDAYRYVNIRDFRAPPAKTEAAFISKGDYQVEDHTTLWAILFKRNLNAYIAATMDPSQSWIQRRGKDIGLALKYEQTVFNYYEVAARKVRKRYREHSRWKLLFGDKQEIWDEELEWLHEQIYNYRITSNYGTGNYQQLRWSFQAKQSLQELEAFALDAKIDREGLREKRRQKRVVKREKRKEARQLKREYKEAQKALDEADEN
ncbi:hypothetical protein K4L44_09735 [Halosquirtibacter laminarini]|uniref:Uncharacterized protein n=1 Tax=Halosquirtibacter laminarini TaxID=3374600 RepID=A0AC61NBK8_9BACT|nr:hypothetical protein K4L44_09735 [Prolixibacteraceae bacterium]